jgi:hypothetical protein
MRFAIDAWAPEYGTATTEAALEPSEVPTDIAVEVPVDQWGPRRPPVGSPAAESVLFVDGVERVEARVWIDDGQGGARPAIAGSFAAGAVRCDGRAEVVAAEVRRCLVAPAAGAESIATRHGEFRLVVAVDGELDELRRTLLKQMGNLEVGVAQSVAASSPPGEIVVVDGPLSQHRHLPSAVGYVKTQHRSYGPPIVQATVARLAPGERTPVFVVAGGSVTRWSWYARLPGERSHPLAGIVRCEAGSHLSVTEAVSIADRVTTALPRFASEPHKDSRAPQNLYPIAGLERELRHRLGDPALMLRALRRAAAA